ncbi:MAG: RNA methyltransferase [Candidatus Margulisbacteria bacterium]|nr:RNA methyltransferase [Candidatus Margulisiibacteriota bacterium]
MAVYIALLHYPVYNKRKELVTTCITGFDLHDIARTAATYGIKKYFVVNPLPAQREFANRIFDFWMDEGSLEFNWTRAEAFKLISIKSDLDEVIKEIEAIEGLKPKIIATSAKPRGDITFESLKLEVRSSSAPYLILLGTGWGMAEEVFPKVDGILPPIIGNSDYNHLSVRSACAIILDRLLAPRTERS